MNKEDLKKIKVLYYPYKAVKKLILGIKYSVQYTISLFYISKNKKRVAKKINNNEVLNVVFVVQYIPGWNKLELIYSKMLKDNRFNPIILCIPLNVQNNKLLNDNGNDTYQYFVENGYKSINSLNEDGSWFDLTKLAPDYVFHSRPYNSFMPTVYTSDNIVKHALICNVLYGMSVTKDIRSITINKDYFKDVFCYFASDFKEKEYYKQRFRLGFLFNIQKCNVAGAVALEHILQFKTYTTHKRFSKSIIWTPRWSTDLNIGGSNFFNYKSTIFELAKEHPEVLFIIRPHPLMFSNFINTGEMKLSDVIQFKNYCHKENNIILDETKEYTKTFWNSDLLITDVSSIIPEYFVTKKPIIYCHSNISYHFTETSQKIINTCYQVKTSNELKTIAKQLIEGNDFLLYARNNVISLYFDKITKHSEKILNDMYKIY